MSPVRPESSQAAEAARARHPALARVGATLVVGLAAAGAAWLLLELTRFEYGLDQGIYGAVADVMHAGGVPYRDAWDFKPPGVFFVYSAARSLFGEGMRAVRLLEALGFASLGLAFAMLSRRFTGRFAPGVLGGALAASGHVWLGFWHTAQPESFGAVLIAWALVLATAPAGPRRELAWAGAGALYTLAALLKPPLGGGLLVSWAFALRVGGWRRATLGFAVGALAPLLAVGGYFAAAGALPDLYEALFVFAPEYTRLNYRSGSLWGFALRAVELLFLRFSLLNPLGLVLLLVLPRLYEREREGALHVLGVLAVVLAGVALQGRFFAYHFGAAVPLLALLAGIGLFKLTRVGERRAIGVLLLFFAILWLANANGLRGPLPGSILERVTRLETGHVQNAGTRRTAAWVAAHTRPGDAIYVWGFQPMIYGLADRRPASRYIYNAPQRAAWYRTRARPLLIADLQRDPPAAILVESGDVHPGTTGNQLDSRAVLARFARLRDLLRADYAPAETVGRFTIHLRKPVPAPPRAPRPGRG
jgi:MFS family permease